LFNDTVSNYGYNGQWQNDLIINWEGRAGRKEVTVWGKIAEISTGSVEKKENFRETTSKF
jgi:hypothetical protein